MNRGEHRVNRQFSTPSVWYVDILFALKREAFSLILYNEFKICIGKRDYL